MAVNIGIIGCGQVAHFHVQGLKKTNAKVVALADISRQNAEALAQKTGEVQIFEDYREMVEQAAIDAVIIGLQNHLHYEALRHAIGHRKAIFCEKPLTADVADSVDLDNRTREIQFFLCKIYFLAIQPQPTGPRFNSQRKQCHIRG